MKNIFLKNLYKFAKNPTVSRRRLRTMSLEWNTPFKIWGETLEGDNYDGREVFSFSGPARGPASPATRYPYSRMGYMIFYDMRKGEPRTFVYDLITHIEKDGVKYKVI